MSHFARQGVPYVVVTGNGPQITLEKFGAFAQEWSFEHRTSSMGHQQTNGKAESAKKMAKRLMRKSEETRSDLYLVILAQRNTPTQEMDSSPALKLLERRCKTLLPTTAELLKPHTYRRVKVNNQTRAKQVIQNHHYNKGAKDLSTLEEGDEVRMRPFRLERKIGIGGL